MKQLTCEMCGSTDLIKDDGVFVCQSCGCKYSVEEAKRMMIEGTVDIQGTVKVDNSAFVEKYLANARRAKEKEDWEETEKYYNMVEQNDPNNIEAIFYSSYGKAKMSLVDGDIYKRGAAFKVLQNCISLVDDHYDIRRREANEEAILSMGIDLGKMVCSEFVFTEWKNGYGVVTKTNKSETIDMFSGLLDAFKQTMNNIRVVDDQTYLHKAAIAFYTMAMVTGYWRRDVLQSLLDEENRRLKELVDKANAEYWAEHAEEKAALDAEKAQLSKKIESLELKMTSLPEVKEEKRVRAKINALKNEEFDLSIFKIKKRKAMKEKIDQMVSVTLVRVTDEKDAALAPIQEEFDKAKARLEEVNKELTREH